MLRATTGEPVPLQVLLPDGHTGLYVRVRIFDAAGTVTDELFLPHRSEGLYTAAWTPAEGGYYTAVYEVFIDAGMTIPAGYEKGGEQIDVNSDKVNIMRLLGLQHENSVVDQQVYSGTGRLLSARVRAYATHEDAVTAGVNGLLFVWSIQAGYNTNDQLTSYKILRGA